MADFDERSGIVACNTSWGLWFQTLDEVSMEISVESSLKSKEVSVVCQQKHLTVKIRESSLIEGELFNSVVPKGTIWTLESEKDQKILRVVLQKQDKTLTNTWSSLLKDQYVADDWLFENMKKKAALEKIQLENPGFDMSGADIHGHYATGGPEVPS